MRIKVQSNNYCIDRKGNLDSYNYPPRSAEAPALAEHIFAGLACNDTLLQFR